MHNSKPILAAYLQQPGDTIYWIVSPQEQMIHSSAFMVYKVNYDVWHKCFGHPSKEDLCQAKGLKHFPNDLTIPEHPPLCRGCAEGKMHSKSFPESQSWATRAFQLVHTDLKSFPVESYSRYKYFISFFDDYTSHAWVIHLQTKDETLKATKYFVDMVSV